MHNNYFGVRSKLTGRVYTFHFADDDRDDIERAFELAEGAAEDDDIVYAYRVPPFAGRWDRFGVFGHRNRDAILEDIGAAEDAELLHFEGELALLDDAFRSVGRQPPGVQLKLKVAA